MKPVVHACGVMMLVLAMMCDGVASAAEPQPPDESQLRQMVSDAAALNVADVVAAGKVRPMPAQINSTLTGVLLARARCLPDNAGLQVTNERTNVLGNALFAGVEEALKGGRDPAVLNVSILETGTITQLAFEQNGEMIDGQVHFDRPGECKGKASFEAKFVDGGWRVTAFEVPELYLRVERDGEGWRIDRDADGAKPHTPGFDRMLRQRIAEASAMDAKRFKALARSGGQPYVKAGDACSLTEMLLSMLTDDSAAPYVRPVNAGGHPVTLADQINSSVYMTLVQAHLIDRLDYTIDEKADELKGRLHYRAPKGCEGELSFTAHDQGDKTGWVIDCFDLPALDARIERGDGGAWFYRKLDKQPADR